MIMSAWRKSSYCDTGTCFEVRAEGEEVQLRDSKLGDASVVLNFNPAQWASFLADVRSNPGPQTMDEPRGA